MRKNKTKGFTLIELLIVIAIIAILAAVLIPNLLAARKRANDTVATAYLSDVAKFEEMYQIDNNSYTDTQGNLTTLGLKNTPANVNFDIVSADANNYCAIAMHTGGTVWFAVDPANGVHRVSGQTDPNSAPSAAVACP